MSEELESFYEHVGSAVEDLPRSHAIQQDIAPSSDMGQSSTGTVSAWAVNGERYWGISHSLDRLPPDCYRGGMSESVGVYLERQPIRTDSLLTLPDSKSEAIIAEITHFTTLRAEFDKRGLLYKRGVLLWGPPGSGKTSTLHLLMWLIVDRLGGIALLIDHPYVASEALKLVRRLEPERQVIGIIEDIDGLIHNHGVELYLSLLDGESQVNNVIYVATTNYPERLDKRFVDRPSRFDSVEYVGMPSDDARRTYLRHKEPDLPDAMIAEMVEVTAGLSIAHLREMIVLTQCFGRTIAEAAMRLNATRHRPPHSEKSPDRAQTGFAIERVVDHPAHVTSAGASVKRVSSPS